MSGTRTRDTDGPSWSARANIARRVINRMPPADWAEGVAAWLKAKADWFEYDAINPARASYARHYRALAADPDFCEVVADTLFADCHLHALAENAARKSGHYKRATDGLAELDRQTTAFIHAIIGEPRP